MKKHLYLIILLAISCYVSVAQTITTGAISGSPFCVSDTVGASVTVSFTSTGTFNNGNVYKAQLSNATGSFSNPVVIGTDTTTANSGTINCTIPAGTATGTRYRIRVKSTKPIITGTKSSTVITINLAANSIAPTADQNLSTGTNGTTLTVTEQSTSLLRRWKYGTTLGNYNHTITGATGTTYTPNFATPGTYYVVCKSFFSCDSIVSNPVKIIVTAPHKIYVTLSGGNCGFYWTSGNPGDTLVLNKTTLHDTICYGTFYGINGTPSKRITVLAEGGVIVNTGSLKLQDCNYIDVNFSTQTGITYGYESEGNHGVNGGPGFEIRGKSSHINFGWMYIHDRGKLGGAAGYGIIIKNDPNDYGCDFSYDFPNSFSNIVGHDIKEVNISQDANYLGSSIGYNPYQQPQVCGGITYYPRPTSLDSCTFYNFSMTNIGRSGFQAGQLIKGNIFHDITGYNMGYEVNSSQGALIAVGNPDSSIEIYNCTANLTYKPAVYAYNYGLLYIHDNNFDSSGYVRDTNNVLKTQTACNIELYPQNNTFNTPMQFKIKNNTLAHNTNIANIALYPGASQNYSDTGNCIQNSGTVYHSGVTVNYSTNCDGTSPRSISNVISEASNTKASLFAVSPNPAQNNVMVKIPLSAYTSSVLIYDATGRKIAQRQVAATLNTIQLDVSHFTAGMYSIVLLQNNMQKTIKLIKN